MSWLTLFFANVAFVRLIGLDQFGKSLGFLAFLKRTSLSFGMSLVLYVLSYPLSNLLISLSLPYLLPLVYGALAYGLYWSVSYLRETHDYAIVDSPNQLRLDFFYQTLTAGLFFYTFSLHPTFLEGLGILVLAVFSYAVAYGIWLGIRSRIKGEIYPSNQRRYWSYYLSILLLSFFFSALTLIYAFPTL